MKSKWFVLLALAVATLAAYLPVLNAGFVLWDDRLNIYENPYLMKGEWWIFWLYPYYLLYIPLTYSLWTAVYHTFESASALHVMNVVVHISTGYWVY